MSRTFDKKCSRGDELRCRFVYSTESKLWMEVLVWRGRQSCRSDGLEDIHIEIYLFAIRRGE